ncbi:MAG: GMC oxidoreductase [Acidobacteriota bacterium]|nr:GMC oxidoreductase [Acidobacteriota bacterium]
MNSNFNSPGVHIIPTQKKFPQTFEVRNHAMVREVLVGSDGLASGVSYVDKRTRDEVQVRAKVVVLAASCCETARLMLNSKSSQFPNGIGNSTGLVGRYIMDTVGAAVSGYVPLMQNLPPQNEDGVGGMHLYVPWWKYKEQKANQMPFARGYHIELGGGRGQPGAGALGGYPMQFLDGGYGADLKKNLRSLYGGEVYFSGRGEMIPNDNSYCEIDPQVVDKWGIPVLRFNFKWSQDEILQAKHMQETFQEIIHAMGGIVTSKQGQETNWGISRGGEIIHEVGSTKMGDNAKTSVLNSHCQSWDVKNLFVTDAAPFVSNADKNPTLTISALGWRTSEYIADQVKKLNVKV